MAHILVVDDRPDNLMIIGRHLTEAGHHCQLAGDAESALEWLDRDQRIDLFLLDVVLPGMSGFELCRRIRNNPSTQDTPVVFLTDERGKLPDKLHGFASGANDYISKPVDRLELVARVEVMLRLRTALEESRRANDRLSILVDERTRALRATLQRLERQRNLLETVVQRLPAAVVVVDGDGRGVTANGIARALLGSFAAGEPLKDTCLAPFLEGDLHAELRSGAKLRRWTERTRRGRRLLEVELTLLATEEPRWLLCVIDATEREAALEEYPSYDVPDLLKQITSLKEQLRGGYRMSRVIGVSPAMARVHRTVSQLRNSQATVLIRGESGTGKELVARAIHFDGSYENGPFVAVDCGAMPDSLAESELFGHVKGAFTGADRESIGLFRQAQGGTIFLDEISQCSPQLQSKLLRVLQSREIRPVGGTKVHRIETRVIAATNRPLDKLVREGEFREDLYYRLAVVEILLPALRERTADIPVLAKHFLETKTARAGRSDSLTGISREAMRALESHDYDGNVRELENVFDRAVALAKGPLIQLADLPEAIRARHSAFEASLEDVTEGPPSDEPGYLLPSRVRRAERETIVNALERTNWNKLAAAKLLGIGKSSLYRKIKNLGIPARR